MFPIRYIQDQINLALSTNQPYINFATIQGNQVKMDLMVQCCQGNLSVSLSEGIKTGNWLVQNWRCGSYYDFYVLARFIRDEKHWLKLMENTKLPDNFLFVTKNDVDKNFVPTILIRRHGKNYVFFGTEVTISRRFRNLIVRKQLDKKFDIQILYDGEHYISIQE